MAYDEVLAERVRAVISLRERVAEKKMFGGIAWMLSGNMACGVRGEELLVRLAPDDAAEALDDEHTVPFEMGGRTSKGFVLVGPGGTDADEDLAGWVDAGADYAASLAPK